MEYRKMEESDIPEIAAFYVRYHNEYEDCMYTQETAEKRIHQVWSREDAGCLVAVEQGASSRS